jgi:hypothetical protein
VHQRGNNLVNIREVDQRLHEANEDKEGAAVRRDQLLLRFSKECEYMGPNVFYEKQSVRAPLTFKILIVA